MYLGKVSDTYDVEGKVEETGSRKITLEEIEDILNKFRGETKQIPPAFSAVHLCFYASYTLCTGQRLHSAFFLLELVFQSRKIFQDQDWYEYSNRS